MPRVLLACEESQAVTEQLRLMGIDAYSCDVLETSGEHPEWHLRQDVTSLLQEEWDMIIAFPPCTYLTVTGNRWFNIDRYGDKARQRHSDRKKAIDFFMLIANAKCDKIAIENPVGIMSSEWRKPDQIIHPYQFGDPYEKTTCLWLKGLEPLHHTDVVEPEPRVVYKSGKSHPAWYAATASLPAKDRSTARSKTFPGIAKAMAEQWGSTLLEEKLIGS